MLREAPWRVIAWIATRPAVTNWLIDRAKRTPYTDITSRDGGDIYMERWWLFNPYPAPGDYERKSWWRELLPSVRIHHIVRPDDAAHLHDHPWNARTIVLRGWYEEERPANAFEQGDWLRIRTDADGNTTSMREVFKRKAGFTGRILFGQFHSIDAVSPGGVWTMFWTWKYRGTWGFDVDGKKVPWREYLGVKE